MTRRRAQEGTPVLPSNLHQPDDCRAASEVLARVGDKWTVLVVWTLGDGSKRFNELRKALGSISQRMFATIPPRVDYELTKLGRSLLGPVSELGLWARKNRSTIQNARTRYDSGQSH